MSERWTCAREARGRGEPLLATASRVRRWIVVEQPGPWGIDAVVDSRLPDGAAEGLQRLSAALGARVILVRRHGRPDPDQQRVSCFVAFTDPERSWLERFVVEDVRELFAVDLSPLAAGRSVGGEPLPAPAYLVCTNGRHDVCCAEFGRPVAAALDATWPERTWECSHIGGDRFAGNLVILPEGLYYGWLTGEDARRAVDRHLAGELLLDHFRGRSCYSFVVQAAEHLIRTQRGLTGIGDLVLSQRQRLAPDRFTVTFATPDGGRPTVELRVRPDTRSQQLTCRAERTSHPPRYELLSLRG